MRLEGLLLVTLLISFGEEVDGETFPNKDFSWEKLNGDHAVCFHTRGNKFGSLTYKGMAIMIGAIKLVHRGGLVRCAKEAKHDSRWGCADLPILKGYSLNVIITDNSNHIIFPTKKFFKPDYAGRKGLWYHLPTTDPLHEELVFTNYATPFFLRNHSTLRVWYGEDLNDQWEDDNFGIVCVDVYAHVQ